MKITTEWLKENNVCSSGMRWFLSQAETDAAKVMIKLVKEDRFDDAFWLFEKKANLNQLCSFALFSAEQVLPIYEQAPGDYKANDAPRKAIAAAKAVLTEPANENKRAAAAAAAYAAAHAAYAAADSAAAAAAYDAARKEMNTKIITYAIEVCGL